MLDAWDSDKASDYIAGFPIHPHRGFEAESYMITGRMRHEDSAGNEGLPAADHVHGHADVAQSALRVRMPTGDGANAAGLPVTIILPDFESKPTCQGLTNR